MWNICLFEIKYCLKHFSTYLLASLMFGYALWIHGGLFRFLMPQWDSGVPIVINPVTIQGFISVLGFWLVFVTGIFIVFMFQKDFNTKFSPILFTKPITKIQYVLGCFLGNVILVTCIAFIAVFLHGISSLLPGIDKEQVMTPRLIWYIDPLLVMIIPNIILSGAIFTALIVLTKRMWVVFLAGLVIYYLCYYFIPGRGYMFFPNRQMLGALVDPLAGNAFIYSVMGQSVLERQSSTVGLTKFMVWNRVLWLSISTILLSVSLWRFNFDFTLKTKKDKSYKKKGEVITKPVGIKDFRYLNGFKTTLFQIKKAFIFELKQIFKSPLIYCTAALSVFVIYLTLRFDGRIMGTRTLLVTYKIIEMMMTNLNILLLAVMTYFSGEMIYKAREHSFSDIADSSPASSFVQFISKYMISALIIAIFMILMVFTGIYKQINEGYRYFEIGLYLKTFFLQHYTYYLIVLLFTFFVHNFTGNKWVAHFIFIFFMLGSRFFASLGIEHNLLFPFGSPDITYSDMSGFGWNVTALVWFRIYWLLICLLLTGATVMCWKRGSLKISLRKYLNMLRIKPALCYNGIVFSLTILVAGYIFYNTNVLNNFVPSHQLTRNQIEYEKNYKHFETKNQPKIQDIKLDVHLYPETASMFASGIYTLQNVGTTHIDTLFVHYPTTTINGEIKLSIPNQQIENNPKYGIAIFKLVESLNPRESFTMTFEISEVPKGFTNNGVATHVRKNGTFINCQDFPTVGYNNAIEITSETQRRNAGLPQRHGKPDISDPYGLSRNYISRDADWISFETTISTSADQIALAPGELVNHWTENNRNYYTYRIENISLNFYTFLSARYEVKRDKWNDIDLEIYYHPTHAYNLEHKMNSMKESLTYYTEEFGSYPYNILRIAEFPRLGTFAQSFPTLIPFSEGLGFIAKLTNFYINYPFYITAHEVGHQWWGHQVSGSWTKGSVMLGETITEYVSLMVVKHSFSDRVYTRQLDVAHREYIGGRTSEKGVEPPLSLAESQDYVLYHKGMLIMNAANRLLGEQVINSALNEFLSEYRFAYNPYPTSHDFLKVLDAYVPDSLKTDIDDMFNKVVLYKHEMVKVQCEELEDESFKLTIDFTTEKRYYDELGLPNITEWAGWLEMGLLKEWDVLKTITVPVDGYENSVVIYSDVKPNRISIDPYFTKLRLDIVNALRVR